MANEELIKELDRIEEDSLHSSKGHFAAGERWSKVHYNLGIPSVVAAALAGATALSEFSYVLAGILSIISAVLGALITFLNSSKRAELHKTAGNAYNEVQNKARVAKAGFSTKSSDEQAKIVASLSEKKSKLNTDSPQIPRWAYEKAKAGIESGEADYRTDQN